MCEKRAKTRLTDTLIPSNCNCLNLYLDTMDKETQFLMIVLQIWSLLYDSGTQSTEFIIEKLFIICPDIGQFIDNPIQFQFLSHMIKNIRYR